jgi:hypothetical protein
MKTKSKGKSEREKKKENAAPAGDYRFINAVLARLGQGGKGVSEKEGGRSQKGNMG